MEDEAVTELNNQIGGGNTVTLVEDPEKTPLNHSLEEQENGNANNNKETGKASSSDEIIIFPVDSVPPWHITLIYAFQQLLSVVAGPVSSAFIIHSAVCGADDGIFLAELIGTSVFMSGLCTLLQILFGLRLPVIQGSSMVFLPVITSFMSTPQWRCPQGLAANNEGNYTLSSLANISGNSTQQEELWKPRMRELSGALIVASLFQVFLGCSGLLGILMRFIGPMTIAPAVSLIGLSLQHFIGGYCSQHWGVSMSTAAVFIIVSQFLKNILVPLPAFKKSRGFHAAYYPIFRLFPCIFAVAFGWILCLILTTKGRLPDDPDAIGYRARTDKSTETIYRAKWFFIPYPGMWGLPTFSVSVFLGMLSATICTIIESIGDYYATARACGVRPPPGHAVNRGIAIEGFGSVICGLFGAGHATTSYSNIIGFIPLTGMGSRVTWLVAGVLMMLGGIFGKLGAVLSTIPDPVIGGILLVCVGLVVAVGLSNLQFVNLNTGRNMTILGTSLLLGLIVPDWIRTNADLVDTGNAEIDQMLTILLGTPMFIGGLCGCFLDNTMPGTREERGLLGFHGEGEDLNENAAVGEPKNDSPDDTYGFPFARNCFCRNWACLTYLPFLPCYKSRSLGLRKRFRKLRKKEKESHV